MTTNRIFQRPDFELRALKRALTDVTRNARQWGALFGMYVHRELLGRYTAPGASEDETGSLLVGALVQEVDAALAGEVETRLISYGRYLGIEFSFRAQRRRDSTEELLNIRAVVGPCDSDRPILCVTRLDPPF
jgi:hypothetical protein